ncbi:MAG: aldose 1-epimerase [Ilumatobacteraceae bacterium]
MTITIANDVIALSVEPSAGGRISSLLIAGRERLVVDRSRGPIGWGCYVMTPWAGRMRHGELTFNGSNYHVPCDLPPHAIHGTAYGASWVVEEVTSTSLVLSYPIGSPWPFTGNVRHEISLDHDTIGLTLELHAADTMPAQVGWHPWFVRPAHIEHSFRAMYVRGSDGIPTGELVEPTRGPHDDCFVDALTTPQVIFDDGVSLELHSDCSHWVVYDEQTHGLCIEPQSGPPNGVNDSPEIVMAQSSLLRTFDLTCVGYPQIG